MKTTKKKINPCWAGVSAILLLMLSLPRPAAAQAGTFSDTGSMSTARLLHTATWLSNGTVLWRLPGIETGGVVSTTGTISLGGVTTPPEVLGRINWREVRR